MSDPAIGVFSTVVGDFESSWGVAKGSPAGFKFGVNSCALTPAQTLITNPTLRGDFNSGDPALGPIAASGSLVKVADVVSFPWFQKLLCGNLDSTGSTNYTHVSIISDDMPYSAIIETSFNINGTLRYSTASGTRINTLSIPIDPTGFLTTTYDLMAKTVSIGDTAYSATGAAVAASTTLTSSGTNPADGDSVKIGTATYVFKDTLSTGPDVPYEVKIGTTAALTLDNLKLAVSAGANSGNYGIGTTINADVTATTNTDTTQLFVATVAGTAGNALDSLDDSFQLDFPALKFFGGSAVGGATDWTTEAPLDHLELASAEVKIGGSPVGYISKGSISIAANLNGNDYRVGASGGRGSLVPGKYKVSGSLDLCLDSTAVLTLITAGTPTGLSFKWAADNNTYFQVEVPRAFLQKTGPTLNGEGAIMVTAAFEAAYDSGTGSMLQLTTGNQTSGATYV